MRQLQNALARHRAALILWSGSVALLALSSAALAALIGPLLRVVFGGGRLDWSPLLDRYIGAPPSLEVLRSALPWVIAATASVKALAFYIERVSRGHIARHVSYQLRRELLCWSLALSEDERYALGRGEIRERLTVDIERVERWLELGGAALLRDGTQALALALSAVLLSGWAGLAVLSVYPLLIMPILWVSRTLKRAARQEVSSAHHLGRWSSYAEAHLGHVSAHQHDAALFRELEERHLDLERAQSRLAHLQGVAPGFTELSVSWVIAGSLGGFVWGLDAGWWSAEELMSLFVCIVMLYAPVKSLGRAQQLWAVGGAALERIIDIETDRETMSVVGDAERAVGDGGRAVGDEGRAVGDEGRAVGDEGRAVDDVEMRDTTHTYVTQRGSVIDLAHIDSLQIKRGCLELRDFRPLRGSVRDQESSVISHSEAISCVLRVGERLALMGDNGAGKSSVLLALLGLIPFSGSISSAVTHLWWSAQPPLISAQALARFVERSRKPQTRERALLSGFQLDLSALRFPLTDQHEVTFGVTYWDWACEISSGERQRVALAVIFAEACRAVELDPRALPLLLLDEPEAHLDVVGRRALIEILNALPDRVTVILATHSLEVAATCERILTLHVER